jgi:hypothetical protein
MPQSITPLRAQDNSGQVKRAIVTFPEVRVQTFFKTWQIPFVFQV